MKKISQFLLFIFCLFSFAAFANFDETTVHTEDYSCATGKLTITYHIPHFSTPDVVAEYDIVGPGRVSYFGSGQVQTFDIPSCQNLCTSSITQTGIVHPISGSTTEHTAAFGPTRPSPVKTALDGITVAGVNFGQFFKEIKEQGGHSYHNMNNDIVFENKPDQRNCAVCRGLTPPAATQPTPEWVPTDGSKLCTNVCTDAHKGTWLNKCTSVNNPVAASGSVLASRTGPTSGPYYCWQQDNDVQWSNSDKLTSCQCSGADPTLDTYTVEQVAIKLFGTDINPKVGDNHGGKRIEIGDAEVTMKKICDAYGQDYVSHGLENGANNDGWETPSDDYHIIWSDTQPTCAFADASHPCLFTIPTPPSGFTLVPKFYLRRANAAEANSKGNSTDSVTCRDRPATTRPASIPPTALICDNDTVGITGGVMNPLTHLNELDWTVRPNASGCTPQTKCEWYCPSATPYYCAVTNQCVPNASACLGTLEVTKTAVGTQYNSGTVNACTGVQDGTITGTKKAVYTVSVRNTGSAPLKEISLYDSRSLASAPGATTNWYDAQKPATTPSSWPTANYPDTGYHPCNAKLLFATGNRSIASLTGYSGGTILDDGELDAGETFTYQCTEDNILLNAFDASGNLVNRISATATATNGTVVSTSVNVGEAKVCLPISNTCAHTIVPENISSNASPIVSCTDTSKGSNYSLVVKNASGVIQFSVNGSVGTFAFPPNTHQYLSAGVYTATCTYPQSQNSQGCTNTINVSDINSCSPGQLKTVTFDTPGYYFFTLPSGTSLQLKDLDLFETNDFAGTDAGLAEEIYMFNTAGVNTSTSEIYPLNTTALIGSTNTVGPNQRLFFRNTDNTWKNANFVLSDTTNVNSHFLVRFKRTKGHAVTVTLPTNLYYAGWLSDAQMPKNLGVNQYFYWPYNNTNSSFSCVSGCTTTQAPSELKVGVDKPIIQCNGYSGLPASKTHFRYKITSTSGSSNLGGNSLGSGSGAANCTGTLPTNAIVRQGNTSTSTQRLWTYDSSPNGPYNLCTFACAQGTTYQGGTCVGTPTGIGSGTSGTISGGAYISPLYTVGTSVVHPEALALGTYTVSCLYGGATDAATAMTENLTCIKTMESKADAQGCENINPYRDVTRIQDLQSPTSFRARFSCQSRQPQATTLTNPFYLKLGFSTPINAYLGFDSLAGVLFNVSAQAPLAGQPGYHAEGYLFSTPSTDVTCGVKVGDGYSTNDSCQKVARVGICNPTSLAINQAQNLSCVNTAETQFTVACNAQGDSYAECVTALGIGSQTHPDFWYKPANGSATRLSPVCTDAAGPGGSNVRTCRITLPTGEAVPVWAGDVDNAPIVDQNGCVTGRRGSPEGMSYAVTRDSENPTGELKYYQGSTLLGITQLSQWLHAPATAKITCNNSPNNVSTDSCSCMPEIDGWKSEPDNSNNGKGNDLMTYSRDFNGTQTPVTIQLRDTAGNPGPSFTPDIGVDAIAPTVIGTGTTSVTLTFQDTGSGLWDLSTYSPTGATKQGNFLWKKISKTEANPFNGNCNVSAGTTNVYKAFPTKGDLTLNTFTTTISANEVIAYCVQDNAGNVTTNVYPNTAVACFSDSNMSSVPTLPTYQNLLISRITGNPVQYGYSFSDTANNASCFRSILASNINTYIANQYNPDTPEIINWSTSQSTIKDVSPARKNTQGYYYRNGNITINTSPESPAVAPNMKVVVAEGGNIQINTDIRNYAGGNQVLVLIARRSDRGVGGNVYINPSVMQIDAIIIADGGAVLNGEDYTAKNWTQHAASLGRRLVINGRVYSYNTRGGSLTASGTPVSLLPIAAVAPLNGPGFSYNGSTPNQHPTLLEAAPLDLERFRLILPDGNNECSFAVHYRSLSGDLLPTILRRPYDVIGTCSF